MILEYLSDVFNTWDTTGHDEVKKTVLASTSKPVKTGEIVGVEYIIGNATDAITMTFNLYDTHSVLIHTKATIAKNSTTVERLKYTTTATTIPIFGEGFVVGFDPSGNSGEIKITGQVRIYYEV